MGSSAARRGRAARGGRRRGIAERLLECGVGHGDTIDEPTLKIHVAAVHGEKLTRYPGIEPITDGCGCTVMRYRRRGRAAWRYHRPHGPDVVAAPTRRKWGP